MERITDKYVFFWGSEFSNWYDSALIYDSIVFYNSEQAFMWKKAMFFNDTEIARKIAQTSNPSIAKMLGRQVKNFNLQIWSEVNYQIMVDINFAKYSQKPLLKEIDLKNLKIELKNDPEFDLRNVFDELEFFPATQGCLDFYNDQIEKDDV